MEVTALKNETKNLIDSFDYDPTMMIYNYAHQVEMRRTKVDYHELTKYRGKIDLDIDLDALRGRNDPR